MNYAKKINNKYAELHSPKDKVKDQTYFLYTMDKKVLKNTIFPLEELNKDDVKKIAADLGLGLERKKESMGICFIGKRKFSTFIDSYVEPIKGPIINYDNDRIIGIHKGLSKYTIGQRKGIDIGGTKDSLDSPWYVIDKNINKNSLIVSQDQTYLYYTGEIELDQFNAINEISNREKVTHGMLEFALSSNKDSLLDRSWEFGAGVSGFTGFLIDYNQQMFVPDIESADMLLKRLELYKRLFSQIAAVQKVGLANNRVATERNLLRTIDQLENYLSSAIDKDPLLLVNFSPEISKSQISEWKEKAKKIIESNIRPTVLTYMEQLKLEHLPNGRLDEKSGIMWIDGGKETYLRALRKYTGHKDITVQEVHEVGLSEIERLKKEFFDFGESVFPGVTTPEEVIHKMPSRAQNY